MTEVPVSESADTPPQEAACPRCGRLVLPGVLRAGLMVCPLCGYHYPVGAVERIAQLADVGSFEEIATDVKPWDPLEFADVRPYMDRVRAAQLATGLREALVAGRCRIEGLPACLGVFDFRFMGGSMGAAVGETFRRLVECSVQEQLPLVVVVASGGARMQEGLISLMQMAKTVVSLEILRATRLPFVVVMTDPTTGGVLASFASLADVIVAEPGAQLCFTGPRVREMTIHEETPEEFGTAEEALACGQVDMVVPRTELRARLFDLLVLLQGGEVVLGKTVSRRGKVPGRRERALAGALEGATGLARSAWRRLRGGD